MDCEKVERSVVFDSEYKKKITKSLNWVLVFTGMPKNSGCNTDFINILWLFGWSKQRYV